MLFNAEQELGGIPLFSYGNINDDIITIINNKLTAYYTKSQTDFLLLSKVDLSVFNNYQIIVDASINSLELNKLDITAFDASWNDLSNNFVSRFGDTITGNYNITGDLYIDGSFTVLGGATFIQTQTVEISDNLLLINSNQTGTPPPTLQSGIEVNRGSENNYQFLFDETSDTFKIGEVGNLQSVATREDTPNNNRVPYWDNTETRFKTDRLITIDNSNNISLGSTPLSPYRLDVRNLSTNDTRVMINDCSVCTTNSNAMLNLFIRENQTKEHIHFRRAFTTGGGTQIKDFGLSIDENAGLTVGKYDNNGNYEELLYVNENHTIEVDGTQGGDFVIVGTPNISLSGVNTNLNTNYYTKTQTDTLLNGKLDLTGGTIAPSIPSFPVPTLLTIDNGNLDIINNGKLLIGGVDVLGNIDASLNAIDESKWTTNGTDIYNDNTGDVGIGLTNPDAKLDIFSTGVIGLKLKRNTGAGINAPIIFRMINSTGDGDWNITIGDELLDNSIFAIHRYNTSITSAPFRITQGDDVEIENDLVVEGNISEGGTLLTSKYLQLTGGTLTGGITINGTLDNDLGFYSGSLYECIRFRDRPSFLTDGNDLFLAFSGGGAPDPDVNVRFSRAGVGGISLGQSYVETLAPDNGMIIEGNVGIGTTSPNYTLHVNGSFGASTINNTDTTTPIRMITNNSNNEGIEDITGLRYENNDAYRHDGISRDRNLLHEYNTRTSYINAGIYTRTYNTDGTGIYDIQSRARVGLVFKTRNLTDYQTRMVITNIGNVGIGISPAQKLEVNGNIALGHRWDSASTTTDVNLGKPDVNGGWGGGSCYITFKDSSNSPSTVNSGTSMIFNTHQWGVATAERMRIAGNGNVTIGTGFPVVPPAQKLNVYGRVLANACPILLGNLEIKTPGIAINTTTYTTILTQTVSLVNTDGIASSSIIVVEATGLYTITGNGTDSFIARILDSGTERAESFQAFTNASGGGTRSGVILPISASWSLTTNIAQSRTISVQVRRSSSDDTCNIGQRFMRIYQIPD